MYRVTFAPVADREMEKLDDFERQKILKALHKLEEDPTRYAKHLSAYDLWSLKIGRSDYRVVFQIDRSENKVKVIAVGKRRNVYDKF